MKRVKNMHVTDFAQLNNGETYILRGAGTVKRVKDVLMCTSYQTLIAAYNIDTRIMWADEDVNNYSPTTTRHYSEFCRLISQVAGDCPKPVNPPDKHKPRDYMYGW